MTVLAATKWRTNAQLIDDVRALGYIKPHDRVLDVTYGCGGWWKVYRPEHLDFHDIILDGVDFRDLPEEDDSYDVVAFDPPYVCPGGRETSTISNFYQRYGLRDTPRTPSELQRYNNEGLKECLRVSCGYVFAKCKDYVSGGKLFLGTHWTLSCALDNGAELVDKLVHLGNPGPQPPGRRQVHARSNYSVLFVFAAP